MGDALAAYFAGLFLIAVAIGAALALGGWFGLSWLFQHVTIGWR